LTGLGAQPFAAVTALDRCGGEEPLEKGSGLMDVLVCVHQVPFMWGGAELAAENLVKALRACGHRAELVRMPTVWDREGILDAALAWRLVPARADLVIPINFPAYFVRHPRKVTWVHHQHRAAYDLGGSSWSDFDHSDEGLAAAQLLADWDAVALGEATRLFTTSQLVADRLARFNGFHGEVLHHPPPLAERLREGPFGREIFCATRLEANKRPELMVEAAAYVHSDARIVVAGRGSHAQLLSERIDELGVDDRISMVGFVSDDDLIERFSRCLAVLYAPFDEDYGYVTLQAFLAGKPVITAVDSGGVLEWVEDGVTGLVTDGSPQGLAAAIDRLAADPTWAARLGQAGRRRVASLSWDNVVRHLVEG
jgi:glycosyltransferase involved in cell wall biosynthesis